jgi:hypothetical protein
VIRLALAVLLTVALLAVSLPAVDDARRERTAAGTDRAVDRLAAAATSLQHDDPVRERALAPRRLVRFRLPAPSWRAAGVDAVRIAAANGTEPAGVTVDLPDRRPMTHRLDAPIRTPGGPLVLTDPGLHRLRLRLLASNPAPVVSVTRAAGDSNRGTRPPTA